MELQLCAKNLKAIHNQTNISVPSYNRDGLQVGIIHIGVGGFHRAHMEVYTHEIMMKGNPADLVWGIWGVGLLPGDADMRAALEPQNFLYTLLERDGKAESCRVVGSLGGLNVGEENVAGTVNQIAVNDAIRIVSLTVSPNGYCLNNSTQKLDLAHPRIANDLKLFGKRSFGVQSAIGFIAAALSKRRELGRGGFTVLSCDNIQHNGNVVQDAVLEFARAAEPGLSEWIQSNATFPNTMVDRITPVTTKADVIHVKQKYQVSDAWPVVCESFRQWIVEDKFACGRPPWESVGAQFVPKAGPYEKMKLRLLNGSHLAIACLGDLAGMTYMDEAIRVDVFRRFMVALMDNETAPTLPPVPGIDLEQYKATLVQRFGNTAIKDTIERVATDAPLNSTLVDTLQDRLARGQTTILLSLALAAWIRRIRGDKGETGKELRVVHPAADKLKELSSFGGCDPRPILGGMRQLFGDLIESKVLVEQVQTHLVSMTKNGVRQTMELALRQASSSHV